MAEPNVNPNPNQPDPTPAPSPAKTFTQEEVDTLIGKRLAKAMKGMPEEAELAAFRAWKDSRQTEQERWDNLTKEKNTAQSQLATAQAELERMRNEMLLISKGIPADDVEYHAFKIGKMVTDSVTFEAAAEQYLQEKKIGVTTVSTSAPVGSGKPTMTPNETMNSLLRNIRK